MHVAFFVIVCFALLLSVAFLYIRTTSNSLRECHRSGRLRATPLLRNTRTRSQNSGRVRCTGMRSHALVCVLNLESVKGVVFLQSWVTSSLPKPETKTHKQIRTLHSNKPLQTQTFPIWRERSDTDFLSPHFCTSAGVHCHTKHPSPLHATLDPTWTHHSDQETVPRQIFWPFWNY